VKENYQMLSVISRIIQRKNVNETISVNEVWSTRI
jgi:hypothetical protein